MRHLGIQFDEVTIPLGQENTRAKILRYSPAGKCPVLHDGDIAVWDSRAIIEYLAEIFPRPRYGRAPRLRAQKLARLLPKCIRALRACVQCCQ